MSYVFVMSSLFVFCAIPRTPFFWIVFCCIRAGRQWAPPISNFCMAQTISVDFTWLDLSVAYSLFYLHFFIVCSLCYPKVILFRVFFCCIRASRQRDPPNMRQQFGKPPKMQEGVCYISVWFCKFRRFSNSTSHAYAFRPPPLLEGRAVEPRSPSGKKDGRNNSRHCLVRLQSPAVVVAYGR